METPTDQHVPPEVAALAELLLERLHATIGNWRIELYATDGHLRSYRRQEEGGRNDLERFDEPASR